jgi:hypothetical protein
MVMLQWKRKAPIIAVHVRRTIGDQKERLFNLGQKLVVILLG